MTLELVVDDLGNPDGPIRHTDLVQLSGLIRPRVTEVMSILARSPVERRRELIDRMTELDVLEDKFRDEPGKTLHDYLKHSLQ